MKYIRGLAACLAFAFGICASAQNAGLQDKDIVASHRQSTGATSKSRATGSTVGGHGAAKSSKLDQQLAKIERQSVKSGAERPVDHASSHLPKTAEQDPGKTKAINFDHQHQRTARSKGSNNRGRK